MSPQRVASPAAVLIASASGNTIVTLEEFKEIVEIPGTSSTERDAAVRLALEAATEVLQVSYGRTFVRTQVARTYRADRADYLNVHDLISLSWLAVDTLQDGSYAQPIPLSYVVLEPFDQAQHSRIRVLTTSPVTFWPGYLTQAEGIWGMVDPYTGRAPAPVRQACVLLADRFLRRNEAPFGVLPGTDISGAVRIAREDPDVYMLMQPYDAVGGESWYVA